jgi:hypothetical protein
MVFTILNQADLVLATTILPVERIVVVFFAPVVER